MKIDSKELLEALSRIQEEQGNFQLYIAILLIIILAVLFWYLKYFIKSVAEETSKKSAAEFESQLSEKIQRNIGLFFRDENVRTNLRLNLGKRYRRCILNIKIAGILMNRQTFKSIPNWILS